MISEAPLFTVEQVCKLALPLGTTIVAASDATLQSVRWAISISVGSPLPYLEGNELVLLVPAESATDITDTIRACAKAKIAALVCLPPISPMALEAAEEARLPVLQLPPGSRVRDIERTIIGLILDRQGHVERRSMQIYEQLVQLASANVGLERIIYELGKYLSKAVVVQDKRLRIQVSAVPPQLAADWEKISESLSDRNMLPDSLRDRHKLPRHTSPTIQQNVPETDLVRLITPIVNQEVGRGYLSFIGAADQFDEVDGLVIDHAAVICALEMARAKAISEIEKKLRGDFLDSLMVGTMGESEAMAEGDRFGHDMSAPHIALVMRWYGKKHPSPRRLETLVNGLLAGRSNNMLVRLHENELRLFYAIDSSAPVQAARQLADDIRSEARREHPGAQIAIGIGSTAMRVNDWRVSYREAVQAADIARRVQSDTPMYIGDLGIYTFLAHPDYRADLQALRDSTIGNLINIEDRQRADLLLTLEAFFQCHGNHTQTAEMLSVHRNTLFYRMNRIAELTGLDLNQPDVRLAVHLSLKIHRLLTGDG